MNTDPIQNQGIVHPETQKKSNFVKTKTIEIYDDEPHRWWNSKTYIPSLEYAFLEDDNKLPVIIVKELSLGEKADLINGFLSPTSEPSLGN
ncbi:hypothetical protein Tco_0074132 [Tanacetum coccineum]